ncbi:MAG: hypothetical protein HC841_05355 [Verrucomicrobiae bacterium]|nr:hypothetical protein [Verrucomicrobiae bacterium]
MEAVCARRDGEFKVQLASAIIDLDGPAARREAFGAKAAFCVGEYGNALAAWSRATSVRGCETAG